MLLSEETEGRPASEAPQPGLDLSDLPRGARLVTGSNGETLLVTEPTVLRNILMLLLKISLIILGFILVFTFLFGFYRDGSADMSPNVNDGDLVMYYRLDKSYAAGDLVLLSYKGQTEVRRVIATAGDTVVIDNEGLKINGALQQEPKIYQKTRPYLHGVRFPVKVKEGEVFVLADARSNGTDSRVYGTVKVADTMGKVNLILRRRQF